MDYFRSTKIPRSLKHVSELQSLLDELSESTVNEIAVYILKSDLVATQDKIRILAHELLTYNRLYTFQKSEIIALIIILIKNQISSNELKLFKVAILEELCVPDSNEDIEISKALLFRKLLLSGVISYKEAEKLLEIVVGVKGTTPEKFVVFFLAFAPEMFQFHRKLYLDMIRNLTTKTQFSSHLKAIINNIDHYEKDNFKILREIVNDGFDHSSIQYAIYKDDVESLKKFGPVLETWISPLEFNEFPDISLISLSALFGSFQCFEYLANKFMDRLNPLCVLWGGNKKIIDLVVEKKTKEIFNSSLRQISRFRCMESTSYLLENIKFDEIELNKALISAAYFNNYHLIFKLIELGADINYRSGETGMTAFSTACKQRHIALIQALIIRRSVEVNPKNLDGETPLISAVIRLDTKVTKILSDCEKVDLNAKDEKGFTALMYACHQSDLPNVEILMSHTERINPNLKSVKGHFPLKLAVMTNNEEIIDKLLAHPNIDVNNRDGDGCTAIFHAVRLSKPTTIIQLMETCDKADPNLTGTNGFSPLVLAVMSGDSDCVRSLLSFDRTDINHRDSNGNTPLIAAAGIKNAEILKLLLQQKKLNINARGKLGNTALMTAAMRGALEIVQLLANYPGVNINLRNDDDNTPLHEAVRFKHTKVVQFLVSLPDITINSFNKYGETPISLCAMNGEVEIMANLLTARGIDANITDGNSPTPLTLAIKGGFTNLVNLMVIAPNVDVNRPSPPDSFAPVFTACTLGKADIVNAILKSPGIRSDLRPGNGAKYLYDACEGNKEVIEVLQKCGLLNS